MDVKVDMGFLKALMGLFSSDAIDRSQEVSVSCEEVPGCLLIPLSLFFFFWGGGEGGDGGDGGPFCIYIVLKVVVRCVILAFILTTPMAWSSVYC